MTVTSTTTVTTEPATTSSTDASTTGESTTTGDEGSSSGDAKWTGECDHYFNWISPPASSDFGGWPTDGGNIELTTTCTMTASVEDDAWIAALDCFDPVDEIQRPLTLRVEMPPGIEVQSFVDEPIELELKQVHPFGLGFNVITWYRMAGQSGTTISALVNSDGASPWTEYAERTFPEAQITPVDLGCVESPNEQNDFGRAMAFEFSTDAGSETLVHSESVVLAPHAIHLTGAEDMGEETCPGEDRTKCLQIQFVVLPAAG